MTRDLRSYSRQTNVRLILGVLLLLFIVGDGLIYFFYGKGAALMGLMCLLIGLLPVALTLFALSLLAWLTKKTRGE